MTAMPRKQNSLSRLLPRAVMLAAVLAGQAVPALAACPVELAVYSEARTGAMIDFRPGGNATATNAFRMVFEKGVVLEGVVMWDADVPRSIGMLTHDCPEGDATGAELAACIVWQGVIYDVDDEGGIDLMPPEGEAAPKSLILADLGRALKASPVFDKTGLAEAPWDAFFLHGCQE
jgi:hypothetical protein